MTKPIQVAEIVAVGAELLTPFRADTNSLWLTGKLNEAGIVVSRKCVVDDRVEAVASAVADALERADLVVTTGGLGPTADDVTREAVASALELALVADARVLELIRQRFEKRGVRMPDINRRQALVLAGATVLPNPNGTAPGLWVGRGDRVCLLLPGPPRELKPMYESFVEPRLLERTAARRVRRRVIAITGQAESKVDEAAAPVYTPFQTEAIPISTSILASPGRIELHLSASGADVVAVDGALELAVARLVAVLGGAVYSTDGRSLEQVVGGRLVEKGLRLAVAESCTGGMVMSRLTDVPGSSAWLLGGVVAYDNAVKVQQLGVPPQLIAAHGAVSEPVAAAMAEGARAKLDADVAVAVTGIAGPTGATPDKPVGTVAVALAGPSPRSRVFHFPGDRAMVRQFSVAAALDMVRRALD